MIKNKKAQLKKLSIIFGIILVMGLVFVLADTSVTQNTPSTSPYETSNLTQNISSIINTNGENINEIKFNWNGTNKTIFDINTVGICNMNNNSALLENNSIAHCFSINGGFNLSVFGGTNISYIPSGYSGGAYNFSSNISYMQKSNVGEILTRILWINNGSWYNLIETINNSGITSDNVTHFRQENFTGATNKTGNGLYYHSNFLIGSFADSLFDPIIYNGFLYAGGYGNRLYKVFENNMSEASYFSAGGDFYVSPTICNDFLFIGSQDDQFYKIYLNMTKSANFTTTGDIRSTAVCSEGYVYVGNDNGVMYQLNETDLSLGNNFTTGEAIKTAPVIDEGFLYFGSYDNSFYKLNATNMAIVGNYSTGGDIIYPPVILGDYVYFGSNDNKLYSLFKSNFTLANSFTSAGDITTILLQDNYIYAGTTSGYTFKLHLNLTQVLNSTSASSINEMSISGENIYAVRTGSIKIIYHLNATDLSLINSFTSSGYYLSTPLIANGYVYASESSGRIFKFSTGKNYVNGIESSIPSIPLRIQNNILYLGILRNLSYYNELIDEVILLNKTIDDSEANSFYQTILTKNDASNYTLEINQSINRSLLSPSIPSLNYSYYSCSTNSTSFETCSDEKTITQLTPTVSLFSNYSAFHKTIPMGAYGVSFGTNFFRNNTEEASWDLQRFYEIPNLGVRSTLPSLSTLYANTTDPSGVNFTYSASANASINDGLLTLKSAHERGAVVLLQIKSTLDWSVINASTGNVDGCTGASDQANCIPADYVIMGNVLYDYIWKITDNGKYLENLLLEKNNEPLWGGWNATIWVADFNNLINALHSINTSIKLGGGGCIAWTPELPDCLYTLQNTPNRDFYTFHHYPLSGYTSTGETNSIKEALDYLRTNCVGNCSSFFQSEGNVNNAMRNTWNSSLYGVNIAKKFVDELNYNSSITVFDSFYQFEEGYSWYNDYENYPEKAKWAMINYLDNEISIPFNITKNFAELCQVNGGVYNSTWSNDKVQMVSCRTSNMYSAIIINIDPLYAYNISNYTLENYPYNNITNLLTKEKYNVVGNEAQLNTIIDKNGWLFLSSGISPSINSLFPLNNTNTTNATTTFSVNITEDVGLNNGTLYIQNKSDNTLIENIVQTIYGFGNIIQNFVVDLANGAYNWWVEFWDLENNQIISGNYTLNVSASPPAIYQIYPNTYPINYNAFSVNTSLIIGKTDGKISKIIYNWNGTNYTSFDEYYKLLWNLDNNPLLGESSILTYDASGNGNNGTVEGGASIFWLNSCKYGGCFNFSTGTTDKTTNIVLQNSNQLDAMQDLTVSAWEYTIENQGNTPVMIAGKQEQYYYSGWSLYRYGSNMYIQVNNGTSGFTTQSQYSPTAFGVWHHWVGVIDGTNNQTRLYLDGVLKDTDTWNYNLPSTPSDWFRVGRMDWSGGTPEKGLIDDVIIIGRALNDAEVLQLHNSELTLMNQTSFNLNITLNNLTEGVKYNYTIYAIDSAGNSNSLYREFYVMIPPTFITIPNNASLQFGNESLGVTFNATDETGFGYYSINDTRFLINQTGFLKNNTATPAGNYSINVTINDTSNNINWTIFTLEVRDTIFPLINFEPQTTNSTNVSQSNIYLNVTTFDLNNHSVLSNIDLRFWARLNNESGENNSYALDYSGYGNNVSGYNGTTSNASGVFGSCIKFDGVDDIMKTPNSTSLNISEAITIGAWIKLDSFTNYRRLAVKSTKTWNYPYTEYGILLDANTSGIARVRMEMSSGGVQHLVRSTSGVNLSEYFLLVATYNGSDNSAKLYLNGILDNSTLIRYYSNGTNFAVENLLNGKIDTNSMPFSIGGSGYNAEYVNASIDDPFIFARELSLNEIQAYYNATKLDHNITNLADGNYNVTAYVQDTSGNINSTSRWMTLDTTSPLINITSPANNYQIIDFVSGNVPINVNFSQSDINNNSCYYSLSGAFNISDTAVSCNNGYNIFTFYINASGSYTLTVLANDTAGNTNSSNINFSVLAYSGPTSTGSHSGSDNPVQTNPNLNLTDFGRDFDRVYNRTFVCNEVKLFLYAYTLNYTSDQFNNFRNNLGTKMGIAIGEETLTNVIDNFNEFCGIQYPLNPNNPQNTEEDSGNKTNFLYIVGGAIIVFIIIMLISFAGSARRSSRSMEAMAMKSLSKY